MARQQSKRKQLAKRVLTYSLMSFSVVTIVTALMFVILGYSFNEKDNRIEQGGLLQFASVPSGATVTLDETELGSRTPSKVTADATTHSVKMDLKGYRTWQKAIDLRPGMIGWLSYARLIPNDINVETLHTLPTLAGALGSPDNKWFALLEDASKPTVIVADISGDDVKYKSLAIPDSAITKPSQADKPQTFILDSWSQNGQYLLIRHTYDDNKIEWLTLDRGDVTQTKNMTALLGINASKVVFGSENGRMLYARVDDVVRRVNLDNLTLSRPLIEHIDDFWTYKYSTLLYTTKADDKKQRTVGYIAEGMDNATTLNTFADDGQMLHVAMGEYFGKHYVAIQHGTNLAITSGNTLPRDTSSGDLKQIATVTLPVPAERLSISTMGRFVIAEAPDSYTIHDLELVKTDTTVLKPVADASSHRPLRWIDSFMAWSDRGGMLRLYEFDGANQQDINAVAEGYDVTLSPNDKYLYSIGHDANGFAFQRAKMIIN